MSKNIGKVTLYDVSMTHCFKKVLNHFHFSTQEIDYFQYYSFSSVFGKVVHIFLEVNQFRRVDIKNYLCKWNITSICSRKRPQQRLFKDTCFGILLKIPAKFYQLPIDQYKAQKGQIIIADLSVLSWKGIIHSLRCLPSKITGRIGPSSDAKLSLICSEKS